MVSASRRQSEFGCHPPKQQVLIFIVIEEFLQHFVKQKEMFLHRNDGNRHYNIAEEFILCCQFGHKGVPALFAENRRYGSFCGNKNSALYVHIETILTMFIWIKYDIKYILRDMNLQA